MNPKLHNLRERIPLQHRHIIQIQQQRIHLHLRPPLHRLQKQPQHNPRHNPGPTRFYQKRTCHLAIPPLLNTTITYKGAHHKMTQTTTLLQAFNQTTYQIAGHSKRTLHVLQDAIANLPGTLDSDMYGTGPVIENFQAKMAACLGKPSAVFFPSGTMAQQIALRIWCDRKGVKRVAYHPLSHLEIHEEDGLKQLHGIESVLLGDKDRLIRLEEVLHMPDDIACLLLELPQREIGGQLPPYEELVAISELCRAKGIHLQLDGARLFEVLPYYQKTAAEVCALFDSVYVSFYKGIGGVAGAILAGDDSFTREAKVWKKRHGGDLISLYPYILTADHYFEQRIHKMPHYHESAKELASLFNRCHAVETIPREPVSNMFHVHFHLKKDQVEAILIQLCEQTGIGLAQNIRGTGKNETTCYFEVSLGDRYDLIPKYELQAAFLLLNEKLQATLPNS